MFEKEAEEWRNSLNYEIDNDTFNNIVIPCIEFGYKEGIKTLDDMTRAFNREHKKYTDLRIANEWHFVSKEGFPNKDDIYLIIRNDGLHLGDYCCGGDGDIDCQSWCDYPSEEEIQDDSVIAWKEIVLPELKESK